MGTDHVTPKKYSPVGPYAPPRQSEAHQEENRPAAVQSDYDTEFESFKPTGQDPDQFSREVAERNRDPNMEHVGRGESSTPHGKRVEDRHDENLAAEKHPPGYKPPDQSGYLELDADEVEKDLEES